jgi:hypothetical protein
MIQSLHGKLNPGLPWGKKAFNTKTFHQLIGLIFTEETCKVLCLEYSCVVLKLGHSENRSEIPRKL